MHCLIIYFFCSYDYHVYQYGDQTVITDSNRFDKIYGILTEMEILLCLKSTTQDAGIKSGRPRLNVMIEDVIEINDKNERDPYDL